MKKIHEQRNTSPQGLFLTQDEKASMHLALERHMAAFPLVRVHTTSPYARFFAPRFFAPALAALVLLAGGGTAFAAQGALPGDLLYSVKIHVNEPVEVALAANSRAKADVEARLATRRVEEAQTLAARGELDASTTQELRDNFEVHAVEAIALSKTDARGGHTARRGETQSPPVPKIAVRFATHTAATSAQTASSTASASSSQETLSSNSDQTTTELEVTLTAQAQVLEHIKSSLKHTHEEATGTPLGGVAPSSLLSH